MTDPNCPGINALVKVVYEVNAANGWHDNTGEVLTPDHPVAQIAALSPISGAVTDVIEAIRKPAGTRLPLAVGSLKRSTRSPGFVGLPEQAKGFLAELGETGALVYGSKTQAISRLRLIDTESDEATRAAVLGDAVNLEEELSDIAIRVLDFVGWWNVAHPDKPIDLQRGVMYKIEVNRGRGRMHGGKRA